MARNRLSDFLNDDEPTSPPKFKVISGKGTKDLLAAIREHVGEKEAAELERVINAATDGATEDDSDTANESLAREVVEMMEQAAQQRFEKPYDAIMYALDHYRATLTYAHEKIKELGITELDDARTPDLAREMVERIAGMSIEEHGLLAYAMHMLMEYIQKSDLVMATGFMMRYRDEHRIDPAPAVDLRAMYEDDDEDDDAPPTDAEGTTDV